MQNGCLTFKCSDRRRSWKYAWKAARRQMKGAWKCSRHLFIAKTNIGAKGKTKTKENTAKRECECEGKVSEKSPNFFGEYRVHHIRFSIYISIALKSESWQFPPSLIAVVVVVGLLQVCVSVSCNFVTQWSEVGVLWNGNGMKWNEVECNQTRNGKTRKKP